MPARILIIEDNGDNRELVRYLFQTAGYTVLDVADGGAGLRAAREENPDLMVCDLGMPVLNGHEVMRQLREDPGWRRVPVIAVTAFSMRGDREKALASGFDGYITKPIDPDAFVGQIEAFLPPALRAGPPHA